MRFTSIGLILIMLTAIAGCKRDESVVSYQAPKQASSTQPANQSAAPVRWTLPDGWKEIPNTGDVRFATIAVSSDDPTFVLTVIPLGPGLPLLQNINRWENQIGLPPSSESDAQNKIKSMTVSGETIRTLELLGHGQEGSPDQAILAAFVERPDRTWYFKLQGVSDKVEQQKPKFDSFVQSIRFDAHSDASTPTADNSKLPAENPNAHVDGLRWSVPRSWHKERSGPMRLMTWIATSDHGDVDIIVSRLPIASVGTITSNLNRWRGMVGKPPLDPQQKAPTPDHISLGDRQADVYDLSGGGDQPLRMRVAMVKSPDESTMYLFRLEGPAEAVQRFQADFDGFVRSVRFTK